MENLKAFSPRFPLHLVPISALRRVYCYQRMIFRRHRLWIVFIYCQLLLFGLVNVPPAHGIVKRVRNFIGQIRSIVEGSSNPCYNHKRTQPPAESCEEIILPRGLCDKCGVGTAVRSDGSYQNCLFASDVELQSGTVNMECLDMMEQFVDLNPCDTERAAGLQQYRNLLWLPNILRRLRTESRQTLDSFVYGICESSCDCIPQYNVTFETRNIDFHRGNCQGHVYYDVCQLYPNIKVVRAPNGNTTNALITDLSTLQPVCPYMEEWRTNHPGEWFNITPTTVDPVSNNFLDGLMEATEILTSPSDKLWRTCVQLESMQHRIVMQPS